MLLHPLDMIGLPLPPAWAVGGEGVGVTSWVPSSSHCSLLGKRVSRWGWYRVNELAQRLWACDWFCANQLRVP